MEPDFLKKTRLEYKDALDEKLLCKICSKVSVARMGKKQARAFCLFFPLVLDIFIFFSFFFLAFLFGCCGVIRY